MVDLNVKKASSPGLLCVACLKNHKTPCLKHKYGRNPWKMSKIGQNSMKKWPFFAIILPWMARYGSKRSFLLIFSARDDLVKVSWKSDVGKCQNQLTPPYFDQLSERYQLLSPQTKSCLLRIHQIWEIPKFGGKFPSEFASKRIRIGNIPLTRLQDILYVSFRDVSGKKM